MFGDGAWGWNGSVDAPTFSPSIKVTWPANPAAIDGFEEWRTERICHSFVRDGMIEFCDDSTHTGKGRMIALPEWEHTEQL